MKRHASRPLSSSTTSPPRSQKGHCPCAVSSLIRARTKRKIPDAHRLWITPNAQNMLKDCTLRILFQSFKHLFVNTFAFVHYYEPYCCALEHVDKSKITKSYTKTFRKTFKWFKPMRVFLNPFKQLFKMSFVDIA